MRVLLELMKQYFSACSVYSSGLAWFGIYVRPCREYAIDEEWISGGLCWEKSPGYPLHLLHTSPPQHT